VHAHHFAYGNSRENIIFSFAFSLLLSCTSLEGSTGVNFINILGALFCRYFGTKKLGIQNVTEEKLRKALSYEKSERIDETGDRFPSLYATKFASHITNSHIKN